MALIHGLGADSESWVFQLIALAEAGLRPLAMDLPGFGKTPMQNGRWNLRQVTADLAGWLGEISPGPCTIAGLSLGGVIAQRLAFDFPEQVERLVLMSTFTTLRPKSARSWAYLLRRGFTVLLKGTAVQAEQVADHLFPDASQAEYHRILVEKIRTANPEAYKAAMRSLVFFDSRRWLERLHIPVLVITGERDGTVPPGTQSQMVRHIRTVKQVIVPEAGHAVIVDQPEIVNRALLEFILPTGG